MALLLGSVVTLTTIFVVTLGIWIIQQFFSPAETATIARIVPVEDLDRANALAHLAFTLAQVIGMVLLAPLLLKLPDERVLFTTVVALYALAAVFLIRMGRLPGRDPGEQQALPLDLRRGWRIVVADRPAFGALLDAVLISVGMSTLVVLVPYYLVDVLHTDAGNTVFVFAPAVVGLLLGAAGGSRAGTADWPDATRLARSHRLRHLHCPAGSDRPVHRDAATESQVELESLENQLGLSARTLRPRCSCRSRPVSARP